MPVVWIVSETSEDVAKVKVAAMEYKTLAEEDNGLTTDSVTVLFRESNNEREREREIEQ